MGASSMSPFHDTRKMRVKGSWGPPRSTSPPPPIACCVDPRVPQPHLFFNPNGHPNPITNSRKALHSYAFLTSSLKFQRNHHLSLGNIWPLSWSRPLEHLENIVGTRTVGPSLPRKEGTVPKNKKNHSSLGITTGKTIYNYSRLLFFLNYISHISKSATTRQFA